jgi:rhodanese-related sulfurtransferase
METNKQIFIDVREPDEYAKEHVEGTINIPMSTIQLG